MKEYAKMFKNMFNFKGRARRREYWVASVINSTISVFLYIALFVACTIAGEPLCYRLENMVGFTTEGSKIGSIMAIPIVIIAVYVVVSALALTVRRYHDVGLPGWVFPICLAGCALFGIGAIVHLVIMFLPSKDDNQYGENPKAPENDEYTGNASIAASIIVFILCLILLVCSVIWNVKRCGIMGITNLPASGNNIATEHEIQEETEEWKSEYSTEEYSTEGYWETTEEDVDIENPKTDGSYQITIGSDVLSLTLPSVATNIYAGDYTLSYDFEDISVEYGDSFCEVTGDALGDLRNRYEMQVEGEDEENIAANIEPTETTVGTHTAYYFKSVSSYGYIYYAFLVDIGVDNYLEVTIHGMPEGFTDADAFEIANLKLDME